MTKHAKIVHKIYSKMRTYIRATDGELTHKNFHQTLVVVMREVRKYSLLSFEKKWVAIQVMTLLLESLGVPPIISHYSSELIADQIESAWALGLHKYKRTHKHCIIF